MSKLINIKEVQPNSFVFEKNHALDPQFCASVIERFEQNTQDQYQGRIGQQISEDTDIKRSTDLVVSGKSHWQDVDRALFKSLGVAIREFRQQFTYFNGPFKDMGYGLQRTAPGEYYHWHIDGGSHEFSQRQLVAIWYLNDVEGPGGETEFLYQQLKIKPEAGKLVLFPPFWTHEHRGSTLQQGLKYIATTWVVFA
jgi:hypothetical protein